MQYTNVPDASLVSGENVAADMPRLEGRLVTLLGNDQAALLKVVVRFKSAPIPTDPTSTLTQRQEQAALSNLETIARAIDAARQASGEWPASSNVFWLTSAILLEATPVFFKALLEQPTVVSATMKEES